MQTISWQKCIWRCRHWKNLRLSVKGNSTVKRTHIARYRGRKKRGYRRGCADGHRSAAGSLYEKAVKEVGEDNAAIFEIHQMMLEDDDYTGCGPYTSLRPSHVNAEYAVAVNRG